MNPVLKPKVWGGRRLADELGKSLPDDQLYGESWEVSDLEEGSSVVANGPLASMDLRSVVRDHGNELVGPGADRLPILVKFIDATQNLSLQVHPEADFLARRGWDLKTKSESWHILGTQAGAMCILGIQSSMDREAFARLLEDPKALESHLNIVPVKKGDTLDIPAGTLHAIGAGTLLYEIQEPSDLTLRVFDWGRDRELHIEDAIEASRLEPPAITTVSPILEETDPFSKELLVETPAFRLERWTLEQKASVSGEGFHCYSVIEGTGEIQTDDHTVTLSVGETVVIPACLDSYQLMPGAPIWTLLRGAPS